MKHWRGTRAGLRILHAYPDDGTEGPFGLRRSLCGIWVKPVTPLRKFHPTLDACRTCATKWKKVTA